MRAALVCLSCSVVWGFGFRRTQGSGRALAPVHLAAPSLYAQENLVRACGPVLPPGPPPKFPVSRGGYGILPSGPSSITHHRAARSATCHVSRATCCPCYPLPVRGALPPPALAGVRPYLGKPALYTTYRLVAGPSWPPAHCTLPPACTCTCTYLRYYLSSFLFLGRRSALTRRHLGAPVVVLSPHFPLGARHWLSPAATSY
jgi:hypothetical protein